MQISVLIRSPKVKRLQKLRFDENFTVTPKIAYHTIDLLIMTFVLHINDVNDITDYFDRHFRPFNTIITPNY